MKRITRCLAAGGLLLVAAAPARAQGAQAFRPLREFSDSIAALVKRVSPTVVQVIVAGYSPVENGGETASELVLARQKAWTGLRTVCRRVAAAPVWVSPWPGGLPIGTARRSR
jgi:hypothetical protein